MPRKGPKCPKCFVHPRAKQIKFLEASPNISDSEVERGKALFKCTYCGYEFENQGGIHRIGAIRTRQYYKKLEEERKK